MNIKLNDVSKVFNGNLVLDHLDNELEFKSLAILGLSGAGKSTLFRIVEPGKSIPGHAFRWSAATDRHQLRRGQSSADDPAGRTDQCVGS